MLNTGVYTYLVKRYVAHDIHQLLFKVRFTKLIKNVL